MIRAIRVFILRARAALLEAQIDSGIELLNSHELRLEHCYNELRRIRAAEATITPASTLLAQALRRK